MKAITVVPGQPGQVQVSDLPDPPPEAGTLLVQGRLLGICGTDADIVENGYGWPPPGRDRLVIGHEWLGTVLEAPEGSGFTAGDLAAGIVRRPDPVPCAPCGHGRMGLLPQRPRHRARHQGVRRIRRATVGASNRST